MTHNKQKKVTKYRGSHTHGGGSKKKRRGAGHRGGRGNAGSGKRADQKKPGYWTEKYFSGPPFKSHRAKPAYISIEEIEIRFEKLLSEGIIQEEKGIFKISFNKPCKLLSTGKPTRKYHMIMFGASKKAQEKIHAAGGTLELPKKKAPKVEKKA